MKKPNVVLTLFLLEIAFALAAALIGLPQDHLLAPSGEALLAIVFGGYLVLGSALLVYLVGAVRAAIKQPERFWFSWTPALAGFPLVVWSIGKLNAVYGLGVTAGAGIAGLVIAFLFVSRKAITQWRPLPLLLTLVIVPTAAIASLDIYYAWGAQLIVGLILLIAPLVHLQVSRLIWPRQWSR